MTDYTLWPATAGPPSSSADASVNLAVEFYVTSQAWLKAIRFWRADGGITGAVQARVYTRVDAPATGAILDGSDVTFSLVGTGWQTATLATPVELTVNQRYLAVCLFPSGYSATGGYWRDGAGSSGITNGPLRAPAEATATANAQGMYLYGASLAYPTNASPNGGNYWVDVTVTDVDPGEGGPEEDLEAEFTPGPLSAQWQPGRVSTAWTPGPLSTSWAPGRITT